MSEYIAMGGYGQYIWPAYGVAAVVLIGLAVAGVRGYRRHQALMRSLQDDSAETATEPRQ